MKLCEGRKSKSMRKNNEWEMIYSLVVRKVLVEEVLFKFRIEGWIRVNCGRETERMRECTLGGVNFLGLIFWERKHMWEASEEEDDLFEKLKENEHFREYQKNKLGLLIQLQQHEHYIISNFKICENSSGLSSS